MINGSVDTLLDDNEGDFELLLLPLLTILQRDNWLLAELHVRVPMTDTLERSVIDGSPQLDGSWGGGQKKMGELDGKGRYRNNKSKFGSFVGESAHVT